MWSEGFRVGEFSKHRISVELIVVSLLSLKLPSPNHRLLRSQKWIRNVQGKEITLLSHCSCSAEQAVISGLNDSYVLFLTSCLSEPHVQHTSVSSTVWRWMKSFCSVVSSRSCDKIMCTSSNDLSRVDQGLSHFKSSCSLSRIGLD